MKYASAMKYGGELVAAIDCDYNSFKELVPLCPNCKEPVYLRIGGHRESVKGKAYQIAPHWCHFKGISAEQVSGCELRVNDYTEKDRAKIAAQARGQRLKLLQRWFWTVYLRNQYKLNPSSMKDTSEGEFIKVVTGLVSDESKSWKESPKILDSFLNECKDAIRLIVDTVGVEESLRSAARDITLKSLSKINKEHIIERLEDVAVLFNARGLETELNNRIAMQAIEFICSCRQQALLVDLVTLHTLVISSQDEIFDGLIKMTSKAKAWVLALAITKSVAFTDWASEFQRLEAEAKQRKDAA